MTRGDLAALVAPVFVVIWSTGFIGAKLGLPHAGAMTFLTLRFALVVVCFAVWVQLARAPWPTWAQARDAAIVGILMHTFYLGGVFLAIERGVEAGLSALIVSLHPVLTALVSTRVLGERLLPVQWLGMALGFAGVTLVAARKLGDGVGDLGGVGLCLAALVAMSASAILQKSRGGGTPMRSGTLIQFAAAVAVALPLTLMFEDTSVDWHPEFVIALGWSVLVLSVGAVSLLLILIRRGGASKVASLFFLVPASTALIAWPLFGETLGPVELSGVAVATLGVAMVNMPGRFSFRRRGA